jgi:peptidyl-prolyl cis-trans isomerase C
MSCSVQHNLPAGKPIVVNGETIARDAIVREMQHHPGAKPLDAWHSAAQALIVRALLLQRAAHLELTAEPQVDGAGRRETEEEALIRALLAREVRVPEPTDAECRRFYDNNRARFRTPEIVEASHILFSAPASDAAASARARADAAAVREALRERPDAFESFAKTSSRCPSAAEGGRLGQLTPGQTTPQFEAALAALRPGEISEPVATPYGYHIVRLERRVEGAVLPYETVAGRIGTYLRDSVRRRAEAQYVARLVSAADIAGMALAGAEAHNVSAM